MPNTEIAALLVKHGDDLFKAKPVSVFFTGDPGADALLNDIDKRPHAFVLACIMDRQIKAERAWVIPYRISEAIGGFSFELLLTLSLDDFQRLLREPKPLHRFPGTMAQNLHSAVQLIAAEYEGDASRIWRDCPFSAEVVSRFLRFPGVGPKIANMAANILARDFKIPFADYSSIDVSADVQVRRVFWRLGLISEHANADEAIYAARVLHRAFPGLMDFPVWEIGRDWCRPKAPHCVDCYMKSVCPTGRAQGAAAG